MSAPPVIVNKIITLNLSEWSVIESMTFKKYVNIVEMQRVASSRLAIVRVFACPYATLVDHAKTV